MSSKINLAQSVKYKGIGEALSVRGVVLVNELEEEAEVTLEDFNDNYVIYVNPLQSLVDELREENAVLRGKKVKKKPRKSPVRLNRANKVAIKLQLRNEGVPKDLAETYNVSTSYISRIKTEFFLTAKEETDYANHS